MKSLCSLFKPPKFPGNPLPPLVPLSRAFQEHMTSQFIQDVLKSLGIPFTAGAGCYDCCWCLLHEPTNRVIQYLSISDILWVNDG